MTAEQSTLTPNDLPFHLRACAFQENLVMREISMAVLGSFEDLYYATVGKYKEISVHVKLMLDNQFSRETQPFFTFPNPPLALTDSNSSQLLVCFRRRRTETGAFGYFFFSNSNIITFQSTKALILSH